VWLMSQLLKLEAERQRLKENPHYKRNAGRQGLSYTESQSTPHVTVTAPAEIRSTRFTLICTLPCAIHLLLAWRLACD
jgi:hypothetical protein